MTKQTYTLAEAEAELKRRECQRHGHSFAVSLRRLMDEAPGGVYCTTCGWAGLVKMGDKP